jgi:ribosome-associated toxin RatA of RatAB toxin-antitoxin module
MADNTIQNIEIDAIPQACFDVASGLEEYPDWASEVKNVNVFERDANGRPAVVELTIDAMIKQITTTVTYTYDEPNSMSWTAEPNSDIKELAGSYEFSEVEGGTSVVYALRVTPAFTIPGFLRRQAERQLVGTALRGLRKRVEAVAGS